MFLVALTGSIATGKILSTVSNIFKEKYGVPVIDSDKIARKVLEPGRRGYTEVVRVFGTEILLRDSQEIDRALLGNIIFNSPEKRRQLNSITHPLIYKEICWILVCHLIRGYQFVLIESPLLFETGVWTKYVHKIIVVTCEDDLQLQRLMDRSNLLESEAKIRISSQMSQNEKKSRADFVIENSSNLEDTEQQIEVIYHNLKQSKHHWKLRLFLALFSIGTTGFIGLLYWFIKRRIFYKQIQD